MAKQTHSGRPTVARPPGQRSTLSLRMTSELFARLDAEAKAKGNSISREAEARIELSFHNQGAVLEDALRMAYGQQGVELIRLFGRIVRHGPGARGLDIEDNWADDPVAFSVLEREITHALKRLRPPGNPLPEADKSPEDRADRLLVALGKITPPDEWKEG